MLEWLDLIDLLEMLVTSLDGGVVADGVLHPKVLASSLVNLFETIEMVKKNRLLFG